MRYLGKFSPTTRTFAMSIGPDTKLSAIALGKILADKLVMPTSTVENVEEFYSNNCKDHYSDNLFYIIETAVIDLNKVEIYKRMFWFVRYNILHHSFIYSSDNGGVSDFFGISRNMSPEDLATVNENIKKLSRLYNGFSVWFDEIDKVIEKERAGMR